MQMLKRLTYSLDEIRPYVNWAYFFHAWQMDGKSGAEREELQADALRLLDLFSSEYATHAVVGIYDAVSDGDDLLLGEVRMPMLRQQSPDPVEGACLCLADFVRPASYGKTDRLGVFAATVDVEMEKRYADDPYMRMLAQTLADRLAEATAERLHEQVRKEFWGYAPEEQLTIPEMLSERFQGIRPAVGYPSLPDTSLNFIIDRLLDMQGIGIRLTEHGAMRPHASVSGLMISHPQARYFNLGKIGDDQLADYADRRGIPVEMMRKFLASNLWRK